jgi:spermidine dehydrogenase
MSATYNHVRKKGTLAESGFFFGSEGKIAPREVMRRAPLGKIAFANSDLSGILDHRASIAESDEP